MTKRWCNVLTVVAVAAIAAGCGEQAGRTTDDAKPPTTAASETPGGAGAGAASNDHPDETATDPDGQLANRGGIVIESPQPLDVLTGSFSFAGRANVNEGLVRWELVDNRGAVIASGRTTATCGTGCVGTFRTRGSVRDVRPGNYAFRAFEPSMADEGARRLHEVSFPVTVHATASKQQPAPPGLEDLLGE